MDNQPAQILEPNHGNPPVTQTPTRNEDMHNESLNQISARAPTQPFNDNMCCFNQLSMKVRVAIVLISLLSIVAGIAVMIWRLVKPQVVLPEGTQWGEIGIDGQYIAETMRTVQLSSVDGRTKEATVYGMGKDDVQVSHFNTQSILKAHTANSTTFYQFLIPVFSIFQKFGLQNKQKTPLTNWLQVINQNIRQNVDKLQDLIAEVFSRGSSTKDGVQVKSKFNLAYVNQTETVWAIVEYDTVGERFGVVPIMRGDDGNVGKEETNNLKAEKKEKEEKGSDEKLEKDKTQSQHPEAKSQPIPSQTSTSLTKQQTSTLLSQVMVQTVSYIKRKAQQSIQVYKKHNEEVKQIHKQLTDNQELNEEWQKALLECGFVQNLVFRCPFKAVEKLVPGMTEQKLMEKNGNYLLTYGLKIVLRENEPKLNDNQGQL